MVLDIEADARKKILEWCNEQEKTLDEMDIDEDLTASEDENENEKN